MYKNILWLIGVGLVTMFLVSCGLDPPASEGQVTGPDVAAIPVAEAPTLIPTLKLTSMPTSVPPTSTPTPAPPTATPAPTHTPTPTKTPIPPTATPSPTPAPTLSADYEKFLDLTQEADSLYQAGDIEGAVEQYSQILALELAEAPIIDTYVLRAGAYEALGNYEAAIADYMNALELGSSEPAVFNNLCQDLGLTEQPEQALPYCEQAVALEPEPDVLDSRGLAYALLGNYEAAIADFQTVVEALAGQPDAESQTVAAQRQEWLTALQAGQNPFTAEVMAELRGETPAPMPTSTSPIPTAADYYQQGKGFFDKQQWAAAIEAFRQAIALAPQTAGYYSARGLAYLNKGDFEPAFADFNQAIALDPENPGPYFYRGHYYYFKGEADRAIADLERAKELGLPSDRQQAVDKLLEDLKSWPQGQAGFEIPPGKALFVFTNYTDIDWNIDVGPHHFEIGGWHGGDYPVVQVVLDPGTYAWQGHSPGGGYYVRDAHGNISFGFTVAAGEVCQGSVGGPP